MSKTSLWSALSFFLALTLTLWLLMRSMGVELGTAFEQWQQERATKNITGSLLLVGILGQWLLSLSRMVFKSKESAWLKIKGLHLITGALTLIVAFFHAWNLGFGMLFFLMLSFIFNSILSSIYTLKSEGVVFNKANMSYLLPTHIVLSVIVTFLSLMHWWLVMTFN